MTAGGGGLVVGRPPSYLSIMRYFDRFQPRSAWADLRYFMWHQQPYRWVFLLASLLLTGITLMAFWADSRFEPEYHRDIVYVEQWPLSRTDKQIIAQQKVDEVVKQRRLAAEKREADKQRQFFEGVKKKADPWL